MTTRRLKPSLSTIESRLCGPSDALIARWVSEQDLPSALREQLESDPEAQARRQRLLNVPTPHVDDEAEHVDSSSSDRPVRPDLLLQFSNSVRRRLAVARTTFPAAPAPGQVRLVERLIAPDGALIPWDFPQPLMVLLSGPAATGSAIWHGWVVSPDTEYAAYWDMVLEPQDEPMDPRASIVQAWNTILVDVRSVSPAVGQLTADRLAAVAALAEDFVTGPSVGTKGAQPGALIQRSVGGRTMVTGTPYGMPGTAPRLEYQSLYHSAAEPVTTAARALLELEAAPVARPTARIYRFPVRQHAQRQRVIAEDHDVVAMAAGAATTAATANAWLLDGRLRLVLHVDTTAEPATVVCQVTLEAGDPVTVQLVGEIAGPRRTLIAGESAYRSPPFIAGANVRLEIGGLLPGEVVTIPLVPELEPAG